MSNIGNQLSAVQGSTLCVCLYVCPSVAGSHGQLGHGNRVKQAEPKVVQALTGHSVVMGACGAYHTMVADDRGRLFVFGKNFFGVVSKVCSYVRT